jgi:hypothetical protein
MVDLETKSELLDGGTCVVSVAGELDMSTASRFKQTLLSALGNAPASVIVGWNTNTSRARRTNRAKASSPTSCWKRSFTRGRAHSRSSPARRVRSWNRRFRSPHRKPGSSTTRGSWRGGQGDLPLRNLKMAAAAPDRFLVSRSSKIVMPAKRADFRRGDRGAGAKMPGAGLEPACPRGDTWF